MKIKEMLDNLDFDKIEKMSPEECKGLLKGFFIGAGFFGMAIEDGYWKNYTPVCDPHRGQDRQDFRKIRLIFNDREDAMEVLDDLREELEKSKDHYVSVRTLYSLADLPTNNVMLNWVWYDLEDCSIAREGDLYILKMPPAKCRPEKDRASDIS